jgi:hypothetical protein
VVLCAWVAVVMARSLRGRPSQVKGASGVAHAMPLRATLDPRASTAPCGQHYGQAGACPPPHAPPPQPPTHTAQPRPKTAKTTTLKDQNPRPALDMAPLLQG